MHPLIRTINDDGAPLLPLQSLLHVGYAAALRACMVAWHVSSAYFTVSSCGKRVRANLLIKLCVCSVANVASPI